MQTSSTYPDTSGYKMIRGQFFQLLPYQILLLVVNSVNGIIDGIFASNFIGNDAMAAIGLFAPLSHFLYAVSIMLVSGSQILYGRYMGKNQLQELRNVFSVNLAFSAIISIVVGAAMALGAAGDFTSLLVSTQAERSALDEYLLGQAIGIPALILGQQLFAFLSLENQTRLTMNASLVCVAVNTVMDFMLVHWLHMGTFGLALGTTISEAAFFAVMACYYLAGKSELKFSMSGFRWSEAGNIVKLGYSGSISRFVEMFRCLVVNFLILAYVGSVGLSSFAASNSVMAVFWPVVFGMMAVNRMLLSISIGEEDRKSTIDIMRVVNRWGLVIISVIAAVLIIFAGQWTRLFFHDPSEPVYDMTVMAFRILPLCMPFSVVCVYFASYTQIIGKKLFSVVLPIVDGFLGVVCFSFLLIPLMKMNGLYIANVLNGAVCLIVITAFAMKDIKRFPRNMEDLLALPENFGAREEEYMDLAVRSADEVSAISYQVEEFCLSRGVDRRRAMLSGLAMEEMAGNVVTHGFSSDNKRHSADIRVTCTGNDVILRLRDNCKAFNPKEMIEIMNFEDKAKNAGLRILLNSAKDVQYHIGINLAFGIAKEVQYKNLLGLNVLMIRI